MKQVILRVTATGDLSEAAGTSDDVPGYAGKIVAAVLTGAGLYVDGVVALYEKIDGIERTVMQFGNLEAPKVIPVVSAAQGFDGLAVTDRYIDGIPLFGGQLYMYVSLTGPGLHKLRLLIDDK